MSRMERKRNVAWASWYLTCITHGKTSSKAWEAWRVYRQLERKLPVRRRLSNQLDLERAHAE